MARDSLEVFLGRMEMQLSNLGPSFRDESSGTNLLVQTAQSDKFNFQHIFYVAKQLETSGNSSSAAMIVQKTRKTLTDSAENVIYLRTQVENIASLFEEIGEQLDDKELLTEVVNDVVETSDKISRKSLMVKAEYSSQEEELLAKHLQLKDEADKSKRKATFHGQMSAVCATGGIGAAVAAPMLATTSVAVPTMVVGEAAVFVFICPATLAAGLVVAGVCGVAAIAAGQASASCRIQSKRTFAMAKLMEVIKEGADMNQRLWQGVGMAATDFKENIDSLAKLNPRRKQQFKVRMEKLAKSMQIFVETLDEYLVWLSLGDYFPANYAIEAKIGQSRYSEMRTHLLRQPQLVSSAPPLLAIKQ